MRSAGNDDDERMRVRDDELRRSENVLEDDRFVLKKYTYYIYI